MIQKPISTYWQSNHKQPLSHLMMNDLTQPEDTFRSFLSTTRRTIMQ